MNELKQQAIEVIAHPTTTKIASVSLVGAGLTQALDAIAIIAGIVSITGLFILQYIMATRKDKRAAEESKLVKEQLELENSLLRDKKEERRKIANEYGNRREDD